MTDQARSGLVRAIEAEARQRERMRIGDAVRAELHLAQTRHDHRTTDGRRRYGLQRALDVIPQPDYSDDGPWTELIGSVCSAIDGIDVGVYVEDPDEDEDPLPIRLLVHDGGESTKAIAYLTVPETEELIDLLKHALKQRRSRPQTSAPDSETPAPMA